MNSENIGDHFREGFEDGLKSHESSFPSLKSNASFSGTFETTPETQEALKQLMKEATVFNSDVIGFKDKATGETAEFVSKRKLREILEKMKEYRDMEIKEVAFYNRPGLTERCYDLLQEVVDEKIQM